MKCSAIVLLLGAACALPRTSEIPGYRVQQSFMSLAGAAAGSHLDLMEDARLIGPNRPLVVDASGQSPCVDSAALANASLCAQLTQLPLRPALLRLVGADGVEKGRIELDRATAAMKHLPPDTRGDSLIAVTVDLSVGIGSYAGPLTRIVVADSGKVSWLQAVRDDSGSRRDINLPMTLKTAWMVKGSGASLEIFLVACRPDLDRMLAPNQPAAFTITFARYYQVAGQWRRAERRESGMWESDDPFPGREKFP